MTVQQLIDELTMIAHNGYAQLKVHYDDGDGVDVDIEHVGIRYEDMGDDAYVVLE